MSNVKGFKVFNSDWTCRGFQYEVGKIFKHEGDIGLCNRGFHFCQKASDCFNYYSFDSSNKVAEVEAIGLVETEGNKSVTNELVIIREIPWQELLTIVNTGRDCTGLENTGNRNTGDWNTGDGNTGNRNTGDWNTGDGNTGNRNTGNRNTGNWNTGDWNTGDGNTGDGNTVDYSSGVFCTQEEKIKFFDKPSELIYRDWLDHRARRIINWNMETTTWVCEENMSDEEKEEYPTYKTTGGYLKVFSYKEAWNNLWDNLTNDEKEIIKSIPNFNAKKFELITGIKIEVK
ncbi:pentapeptide repeat-containing protein [Clostridium sp.]|uniref:pentapeptide repeat-containing protein n=1 Tax=Clostridium sp. TaxID=1506 RepID=UPI0028406447|nr:pentapeptide repeat-containing protein [Clostridium sp.]MDR3595145.1 pentapeptide repeat-containing protein [Clostridium sp.]